MRETKKRPDRINDIRNGVLKSFYKNSDIRGRTWGVEDGDDQFFGSHILIGDKESIVLVVEHRRTKELSVFEFSSANSATPLGDKIRAALEEHGYSYNKIVD